MSKSLFLTYESKLKIASTIDNLIIAKKLLDVGCKLPDNTNFVGDYGDQGGSLFEKGVSFLFGSNSFHFCDPPSDDAAQSMDYRYAFEFHSPLVQQWQEILFRLDGNEEIQNVHEGFQQIIEENYCDDVEMRVDGTFIPGGMRIMIFGFDGCFHEILDEYILLKRRLEEAINEWSNRLEEEYRDDEVA